MNYYTSNLGDDNNSGTTELTPWKTISKVNNFKFQPGDIINFKCGNVWREQIIPCSGNINGTIKYTSYGLGNKPLILGSISKTNENDWVKESDYIWKLNSDNKTIVSKQIIDMSSNIKVWNDTDLNIIKGVVNNNYTVVCKNAIKNLIIFTNGIKIQSGKNYKVSLKVMSTKPLSSTVKLMEDKEPWNDLYSVCSENNINITNVISTYEILYQANISDDNTRISLLFSNIPENTCIYLNSIVISELLDNAFFYDVGNIWFNNNAIGFKKLNKNELTQQNDFCCCNNKLFIYSTDNPAKLYSQIELSLSRNIIDQSNKSYVKYENLELKYGGIHGIGGDNVNNISMSNCEIHHIGGGLQKLNGVDVRYGNGIELWNNACDVLVDGCIIHDIYDSGITNQGIGDSIVQRNITFKNNKIWNCTYSIEIWLRTESSLMENIVYESNTCMYAGKSWSSKQRDFNLGRDVCLYDSTSKINDLKIINNVFIDATESTIYRASVYNEFEHVTIENNYITQHSAIIRDNYDFYDTLKFEAGKTALDNTIGILLT